MGSPTCVDAREEDVQVIVEKPHGVGAAEGSLSVTVSEAGKQRV